MAPNPRFAVLAFAILARLALGGGFADANAAENAPLRGAELVTAIRGAMERDNLAAREHFAEGAVWAVGGGSAGVVSESAARDAYRFEKSLNHLAFEHADPSYLKYARSQARFGALTRGTAILGFAAAAGGLVYAAMPPQQLTHRAKLDLVHRFGVERTIAFALDLADKEISAEALARKHADILAHVKMEAYGSPASINDRPLTGLGKTLEGAAASEGAAAGAAAFSITADQAN